MIRRSRVTITPDNIEIHHEGIKGTECKTISDRFIRALGSSDSREETPEMFMESETEHEKETA